MRDPNEVSIPEDMKEQFQSRRQDELDRTAAVIQEQLTKGDSTMSEVKEYRDKIVGDVVRARQVSGNGWWTTHSPVDPVEEGFTLSNEEFQRRFELYVPVPQQRFSDGDMPVEVQRGPKIPDTDEVLTLRMLFAAEAKPEEFVLCVLQNGTEEDAKKEWNDLNQPGSFEDWEDLSDTGRFVRGVAHVKRMLADESLRVLKETE